MSIGALRGSNTLANCDKCWKYETTQKEKMVQDRHKKQKISKVPWYLLNLLAYHHSSDALNGSAKYVTDIYPIPIITVQIRFLQKIIRKFAQDREIWLLKFEIFRLFSWLILFWYFSGQFIWVPWPQLSFQSSLIRRLSFSTWKTPLQWLTDIFIISILD